MKNKENKQTKKQLLINMMKKPTGVRLETLVDKMGWRKHTTLGFISNLRKGGMNIVSSKGATGVVYRLVEKIEVEVENETLSNGTITDGNIKTEVEG